MVGLGSDAPRVGRKDGQLAVRPADTSAVAQGAVVPIGGTLAAACRSPDRRGDDVADFPAGRTRRFTLPLGIGAVVLHGECDQVPIPDRGECLVPASPFERPVPHAGSERERSVTSDGCSADRRLERVPAARLIPGDPGARKREAPSRAATRAAAGIGDRVNRSRSPRPRLPDSDLPAGVTGDDQRSARTVGGEPDDRPARRQGLRRWRARRG